MYQFYDPDTVHSLPISSKIESERSDNNMFEFEISGIHVFVTGAQNGKVPCVIYNSDQNDGLKVYEEIQKITDIPFTFAVLSGFNWNDDLSPWYMKKTYSKDSDYLGKADDFLYLITNKIMPQIEKTLLEKYKITPEYYSIIGYSLAGLFALYCGFKTDKFKKIASVSGSMWFENFEKFVQENDINSNVKKIYFSLGNKEKQTNNPILKNVEEKTIVIEKIVESKGVETTFEMNNGNHFAQPEERLAKAIKWLQE